MSEHVTKKTFRNAYFIGALLGATIMPILFHLNAANEATELKNYIPPFIVGMILGILSSNVYILRKVLLQLRIEKQKALKAAQIKSDFLANMSHEIRTPMNAIVGFSTILTQSKLSLDQQKSVNAINSAGKTLLTIINDILDFSKIESGKLSITRAPFSLQTLFEELSLTFKQAAQEKGITFECVIANEFPNYIHLDEVRVHQILINLVGNALKFTSKGSVTLFASIVSQRENRCDLSISCSDTGIGVPNDQKENILAPFTQIEGQDQKLYGGTGLGLSISNKLTQLQNGTLSLKDNVPNGTIFTITFNDVFTSQELLDQEREHQVTIGDLSGKTILVVDDVSANRMLLSMQLEASNVTIVEAKNGQEALDLYTQHHPDLVLMDIKMPVKDGIEATKELRQNHQTLPPIIALSADVLQRNDYQAKLFDDALSKPIDINALFTLLNRYLVH